MTDEQVAGVASIPRGRRGDDVLSPRIGSSGPMTRFVIPLLIVVFLVLALAAAEGLVAFIGGGVHEWMVR